MHARAYILSLLCFTGTGKWYSSGNDLSNFQIPPDEFEAFSHKGKQVLRYKLHHYLCIYKCINVCSKYKYTIITRIQFKYVCIYFYFVSLLL